MKQAIPVKVWKLLLIAACAVLVVYVGAFIWYRVFIRDRSNIDLSEFGFVTDYLHNTYGGDYTINRGHYECFDYGITANQRQYYFYLSDTDGTQYVARYCQYAQLTDKTVMLLTFEKVTE